MNSDTYSTKIKKPAPWSPDKALMQLATICARSEQCESDLREKLRRHAVNGRDADAVIDYLYEHKYLDEERFASSYTRDKLHFNGWGRIKIKMMLRDKRISGAAIDKALSEINSEVYYNILLRLVRSASRSLQLKSAVERQKLIRRLYARGFEPAMVANAIDDYLADPDL